jgi:hypothetical protein
MSNLADEYSAFKSAWTSVVVPPLDGILVNGSTTPSTT